MGAIRPHKASITLRSEEPRYIVTQTPNEVATAIEEATRDGRVFVELTHGTPTAEWNGRPFFLRASDVVSIDPPMNVDDE